MPPVLVPFAGPARSRGGLRAQRVTRVEARASWHRGPTEVIPAMPCPPPSQSDGQQGEGKGTAMALGVL